MYSTEHKRLLINIFEENKEISFSAGYLVDNLKDSMNKATVYRQLKSLEEEHIIRKNFNNESNSYEYQLAKNCNEHLHLKCRNCGKIIHLECKEAVGFINHIFETHGFSINQYFTSIEGICKECRL